MYSKTATRDKKGKLIHQVGAGRCGWTFAGSTACRRLGSSALVAASRVVSCLLTHLFQPSLCCTGEGGVDMIASLDLLHAPPVLTSVKVT